jgi:hypothetical protein
LGGAPVRLDITSTTLGGWHTNGDDYGEIFERLNISTSTGAWRLAGRFDTATFISEPSDQIRDRYAVEKASIAWGARSIEVIGGDAYVNIGRGLALSLRKIDELGVDTTLRGLKLLVHEGAFGGTFAVGFANLNNLDEASGKSIEDSLDLIGGLEARLTLAENWTVALHGSAVAFERSVGLVPVDRYRDRYFTFGPALSATRLFDAFDFYLEGVAQLRDGELGTALDYGLYGLATLYLGPATLLFEGKAYGGLAPIKPNLPLAEFDAVAYNNPPTVERVIQVIENPQRNIAGGRVRFDWSFSPAFLVYVNYGLFRDWEGYADPTAIGVAPGTIHDPYAGFEARWNDARSWALFTAGWRGVLLHGDDVVRGDLHFELNGAQAIDERFSLTLHALHIERKKHVSRILDEEFREGTLLVGVRIHPWIGIGGGYDYTTEPGQPKRDYFSGNVEWYITPSSTLRVFAGSARGGLRCTSGVCRVFPPFEGAKVTATLRF